MDISGIDSIYNTARTDAASASSNTLQSSLKKISTDSSEDELKGAIKDFESYFVEQMLKEMKEFLTTEDEGDQTMNQYRDLFMDQAIEQVADVVVDQVGESMTQQLYEQMKRNIGME